MAKVLSNTIKYFEGKKRNIGIVLLWTLHGLNAFFPDLINNNQSEFIRMTIDVALIGGTMDAIRRSLTKKNKNNEK